MTATCGGVSAGSTSFYWNIDGDCSSPLVKIYPYDYEGQLYYVLGDPTFTVAIYPNIHKPSKCSLTQIITSPINPPFYFDNATMTVTVYSTNTGHLGP